MDLYADDDGTMHVAITAAATGQRFKLNDSLLVLRLWHESANVVRASVHHPASGTTAYVQSSDELAGLSRALELELK